MSSKNVNYEKTEQDNSILKNLIVFPISKNTIRKRLINKNMDDLLADGEEITLRETMLEQEESLEVF